jgi:hypothetical protein
VRNRRTLEPVQRDSDEDAWRTIVENYGERVELDDDLLPEAADDPLSDPLADPLADPLSDSVLEPLLPASPESYDDDLDDPDDEFVPPEPPPLPKLPPDRLLAWAGLFGSPTLLLICLVLGIHLAPWLGYLLVASFIGGFAYLVVKMPRGPADPWDDGARL